MSVKDPIDASLALNRLRRSNFLKLTDSQKEDKNVIQERRHALIEIKSLLDELTTRPLSFLDPPCRSRDHVAEDEQEDWREYPHDKLRDLERVP